mmetsp:Transcript_9564/g.28990  ORF Transcript_9564/g.28990 Transcript_9564/m.28990 type:complete len:224 (-) Transcript_9564:497-1168(-)
MGPRAEFFTRVRPGIFVQLDAAGVHPPRAPGGRVVPGRGGARWRPARAVLDRGRRQHELALRVPVLPDGVRALARRQFLVETGRLLLPVGAIIDRGRRGPRASAVLRGHLEPQRGVRGRRRRGARGDGYPIRRRRREGRRRARGLGAAERHDGLARLRQHLGDDICVPGPVNAFRNRARDGKSAARLRAVDFRGRLRPHRAVRRGHVPGLPLQRRDGGGVSAG